MAGTSLKEFLLKLNKNYHILREREAKYASAAPLNLLNQIDDYEQAIGLTEQAIDRDVSLDDLQAEFSGLNLQIDSIVFVAQVPPRKPFTGQNPYRGLRKFTENEAEFFFGRDTAIQSLLDTVRYLVETETSRQVPNLVAVLGASGSGKSSLVRAGLIPALQAGRIDGSDQWLINVMLPGPRPLDALAERFIGEVGRGLGAIRKELDEGEKALHYLMVETLAGKPPEAVYVLVVDQFEELFTLCEDEAERRAYLEQLLYASQVRGNRGFVILTMRADFYAKAAHYKNLAETITRNQMLVSPLTEKELREAILLPAEAVGLEVEKDLAQKLLDDTVEAPGVLPLLQHALLELFERRDGNLLTMQAYSEIGGVKGALAHRADAILENMPEVQQQAVRRILMRLVQPGEGTSDTRRRASFSEVLPHDAEAGEIETIIQRLAAANLIVTDRHQESDELVLDVSHEALIKEWPRFQAWLDADRRGLRIRQQVSQASRDWDARGRDEDSLYRGARLLELEEWVAANPGEINPQEQEFLTASIEARDRAEAERRRRTQRIVAGLAVGLVLVAIAAAFGFIQQRQARQQQATAQAASTAAIAGQNRANAESTRAIEQEGTAQAERAAAEAASTRAIEQEAEAQAQAVLARDAEATAEAEKEIAEAERTEAERQAGIALSRQLAIQSDSAFDEFDYDLALLLGIEAGRAGREAEADTFEAYAALRQTFVRPGRTRLILTHNDLVWQAQWNQDESLILTSGSDNNARVWDAQTGQEILRLTHGATVAEAQWNQDESLILTRSRGKLSRDDDDDSTARVWDAQTGQEILRLPHDNGVDQALWNQDESLILTVSDAVRVWDGQTGQEILRLPHDGATQAQWNRDESLILTRSALLSENSVRVWDAQTGQETLRLIHDGFVSQAQWNQDGSLILTHSGGTVHVWEAQTGQEILRLPDVGASQAQWSQDESLILTSSFYDGIVQIWDAQTGQETLRLIHDGRVSQAQWNQDESLILTSSGGTVQVWDAQTGQEILDLPHNSSISQAQWNQDESLILTISGGTDGIVRVWDAQTGRERFRLTHSNQIDQAQWNQDESLILTRSFIDGTVRVWDVQTGQERLPLIHDSHVSQAQWNQDERLILTISGGYTVEGTARVWDAQTGQETLRLTHDGRVSQAQWNRDESLILTGSDDKTVRMWVARTGQETLRLTHDGRIDQAQWNQDESLILTRSFDDGTVRIWDAQTGQETLRLTHDAVDRAIWNQDESLILTSGWDETARVWDAQTGQERLRLTHDNNVHQAQWNQDESLILTSSWRTGTLPETIIRVWDATTGQERLRLTDQASTAAQWNQDGSLFLTLSKDRTLAWDAETGQEQFAVPGSNAVWNADESLILTHSSGTILRVWDVQSGQERLRLARDGGFSQAQWNQDESLILTSTGSGNNIEVGTVRVWDAQTGQERFAVPGDNPVWNADESLLMVTDGNKVLQYYTQMEDLLRVACERAPRNMTRAEWSQFMGDEPYRATCPHLPLEGE